MATTVICLCILSYLTMETLGQTCSKRFSMWDPNHSMCQKVSDKLEKAEIPTGKERQAIIDEHNKYRSQVTPTATDMRKMYWDDELADMVKGWLSTCVGMQHDTNQQRFNPGKYGGTGQNLASGTFQKGWVGVVAAWHSEVSKFTYGDDAAMGNIFKDIGHYTQVVWAETALVGCAKVSCKGHNTVYGCNYGAGGNLGSRLGHPYKSGSSCKDCSGKCSNKLCDCKGKLCYYGKLNLQTCGCTCQSDSSFFLPDKQCALDCSKAPDEESSGKYPASCTTLSKKSNKKAECHGNYPYKALACPWTCQLCPAADIKNLGSGAGQTIASTFSLLMCLMFCLY